jgi:hypothetical protein
MPIGQCAIAGGGSSSSSRLSWQCYCTTSITPPAGGAGTSRLQLRLFQLNQLLLLLHQQLHHLLMVVQLHIQSILRLQHLPRLQDTLMRQLALAAGAAERCLPPKAASQADG